MQNGKKGNSYLVCYWMELIFCRRNENKYNGGKFNRSPVDIDICPLLHYYPRLNELVFCTGVEECDARSLGNVLQPGQQKVEKANHGGIVNRVFYAYLHSR